MSRFVAAFFLPPAVVFVLQAVLNRVVRGRSPQLLTMAAMVLGYPLFFAGVVCLFAPPPTNPGFYAYMFLLYSFSAYSYFHVFNMSETARRIRMVVAVAKGGLRRAAEAEGIFDEDLMVRVRLERLKDLGQIREDSGLYYSAGRLFPAAGCAMFALSRLLARPWPPMLKHGRSRLRR